MASNVQEFPILKIDADFGSGTVTGIFELYGGESNRASVDERIENTLIVDNGASNLLGLLSDLAQSGSEGRKGLHIDVGGGQHTFQVDCQIPEGAETPDGTPVQWGSSATVDDPPTQESATGAHPVAQQNVLNNYLRTASPDSLTPATLEYGLWSSQGPLSPLDVIIKQPNVSVPAGNPRIEVQARIAETQDATQANDAAGRVKRGVVP